MSESDRSEQRASDAIASSSDNVPVTTVEQKIDIKVSLEDLKSSFKDVEEEVTKVVDLLNKEAERYKRQQEQDVLERDNFLRSTRTVYPEIVQTDHTHTEPGPEVTELLSFSDTVKKLKEMESNIESVIVARKEFIEKLKLDMDTILGHFVTSDPPIYNLLKDHFDPILLQLYIENNNLSTVENVVFKRQRLDVIQNIRLDDGESDDEEL